MAGVKGRSGRRPLTVEAARLRVIDKAWQVTEQYIESPADELKGRAEIASRIVTRDMQKDEGASIANIIVNNNIRAAVQPMQIEPNEQARLDN